MDTIQNLMDTANFNMARFVANPYVSALLLIVFIMYAGLAAPALPNAIARLFDYTLFKVLFLALLLFVNNFNPSLAIIMAIGFFITLQTLSRHKLFDFAGEVSRIKKLIGLKSAEDAKMKEETIAQQQAIVEDDISGANMNQIEAGMADTQVSGLAARVDNYDGPQGMEYPTGYAGPVEGADANF